MAEGPSDSLYLSQQETPLIQNGEVSRVPRFGQIDNIQVSMNPFAPQGPSVSIEDLERLGAFQCSFASFFDFDYLELIPTRSLSCAVRRNSYERRNS